MNFKTWFKEFEEETGEYPNTIIFGTYRWGEVPIGKLIEIDKLSPEFFNKEFEDDYGDNNSPDFCAWSPSYVIFSDNYDGAESIKWVPCRPNSSWWGMSVF